MEKTYGDSVHRHFHSACELYLLKTTIKEKQSFSLFISTLPKYSTILRILGQSLENVKHFTKFVETRK